MAQALYETKDALPAEAKLKAAGGDEAEESWLIEGYCSVFDVVDHHHDVIRRGAYADTIAEKFTSRKDHPAIKGLWQHYGPFSRPIELFEDAHGVWVKGKVAETDEGRDRLKYIEERIVDTMSVGIIVQKSIWHEDELDEWGVPLREILKLEFFEYSPVTWAANDATNVQRVGKSAAWIHHKAGQAAGDPEALVALLADTKSAALLLDYLGQIKGQVAQVEALLATFGVQKSVSAAHDGRLVAEMVDSLGALAKHFPRTDQ